jgi:hypothetical protein
MKMERWLKKHQPEVAERKKKKKKKKKRKKENQVILNWTIICPILRPLSKVK